MKSQRKNATKVYQAIALVTPYWRPGEDYVKQIINALRGRVENGDEVAIFRFLKPKSLKNSYAKQLLKYVEENFRTLPFAERWLKGVVPDKHHGEAFRELLSSRALMGYPVFVEISRKPVAQAEHTILIVEDGCVVLT